MRLSEAVQLVLEELTGSAVCFEISNTLVKNFLKRGFRKVREWYEEPQIVETIDVAGNQASRYVLKSSMARTPHVMRNIYADDILVISVQTAEADLLGLPGYRDLEYNRWLQLETAERWLGKALDKYFTVLPEWRELPDRYLLEGSSVQSGNRITLQYSPWPESFEEVTVEKALDLIIEYATAKTAYALGRARSKFEGGDLEFQTDGKDLINEANQFFQQFDDRLQRLDYQFTMTEA